MEIFGHDESSRVTTWAQLATVQTISFHQTNNEIRNKWK